MKAHFNFYIVYTNGGTREFQGDFAQPLDDSPGLWAVEITEDHQQNIHVPQSYVKTILVTVV